MRIATAVPLAEQRGGLHFKVLHLMQQGHGASVESNSGVIPRSLLRYWLCHRARLSG